MIVHGYDLAAQLPWKDRVVIETRLILQVFPRRENPTKMVLGECLNVLDLIVWLGFDHSSQNVVCDTVNVSIRQLNTLFPVSVLLCVQQGQACQYMRNFGNPIHCDLVLAGTTSDLGLGVHIELSTLGVLNGLLGFFLEKKHVAVHFDRL